MYLYSYVLLYTQSALQSYTTLFTRSAMGFLMTTESQDLSFYTSSEEWCFF